MQVYAKTDESDVGQIRPGQKVVFKVDAYPRDAFSGVVSQVRMNSTVVQNVVTYDTIIDFDNPEVKLFPGMTAYVTIPVATANAVKVPNGALRYKPDFSGDEIRALYQQHGIPEGPGQAQTTASPDTSGARPQAAVTAPARSSTKTSGAGSKPSSASAVEAAPRYDTQIVWKLLPDKSLQPVRIKTGITDHTFTELVQELNGNLKPGDELITGVAQGRASSGTPRLGSPGAAKGR
jgi:HlyD family secretion protein